MAIACSSAAARANAVKPNAYGGALAVAVRTTKARRQIMREIAQSIRDKRSYFTDDTLRTIGLFARATSDAEPENH